MKVRIALVLVAVAALVHVACGSDDAATESSADAGANDASKADGAVGNPTDAGGGADACAVADAGEGKACNVDGECTCNTVCVLAMCMRRSACDEALLTWDGPTSNQDGTCLENLGGFMVKYALEEAGVYDHVVDAGMPCIPGPKVACGDGGMATQLKCAWRVTGLEAGTWSFYTTAYTDGGVESPPSNGGSKAVHCP